MLLADGGLQLTSIAEFRYQPEMFRPTLLATGLLIASNAGCASVGVRSGWYSERTAVYPATAVDTAVVAFVAAYPFRPYTERWFPPDAQEGLAFLFLPASIIDLPLAIAVDTLFLPMDIYRYRQKAAEASEAAVDIRASVEPELVTE